MALLHRSSRWRHLRSNWTPVCAEADRLITHWVLMISESCVCVCVCVRWTCLRLSWLAWSWSVFWRSARLRSVSTCLFPNEGQHLAAAHEGQLRVLQTSRHLTAVLFITLHLFLSSSPPPCRASICADQCWELIAYFIWFHTRVRFAIFCSHFTPAFRNCLLGMNWYENFGQ